MSRFILAFVAASALGAHCDAPLAQQGVGLLPNSGREQRLRLGGLELELAVADIGAGQRVRLFGDYYLTGPGFGEGQVAGGLRLTSGLAIGPRNLTVGLPPLRIADDFRLGSRLRNGAPERDSERVTLPYLGLGYSSLSAQGGWGVTADIGLAGQRPGEPLRLGRSGPTAAQVENVLNDLRLSPVWQLGVSYAF